MTISSTTPGYFPAVGVYQTPVQIGTVNNLTVARSPGGKALFGWNDPSTEEFYIAVRDDFEDIFRDDIVEVGDVRTVYSVADRVARLGSIWVAGGELYCNVNSYGTVLDGGFYYGRNECFIADDPENPTSIALVGQVDQSGQTNPYTPGQAKSGGPVTVTANGTWLLPMPLWGGITSTLTDFAGLSRSTDQGVTWAALVFFRNNTNGVNAPNANTIAEDPNTGILYWSHYRGAGADQGRVYASADDGTSVVQVNDTASQAWNFYTDDATSTMYAAGAIGASGYDAYAVNDPTDNATGYVDTGTLIINSNQADAQFQYIKFAGLNRYAVIDKNRVAGAVSPWHVGFVGTR